MEGFYKWVNIVICLPVATVLRFFFGLCLMVGYVATRLALQGWRDKQNPMPKWRCRLMCVTQFLFLRNPIIFWVSFFLSSIVGIFLVLGSGCHSSLAGFAAEDQKYRQLDWAIRFSFRIGTGYQSMVEGKYIVLNLGFSHPVRMEIPDGIQVKVEENTRITVSGHDKSDIGQFSASIRKWRPPEPYKDKGFKYADEIFRRK